MRRLGDGLESDPLVPADLALVGAQADRLVAVLARTVEQRLEQLLAGALAAPARDDGDRQLRGALVDEAEAGLVRREDAVPGGAVRVRAFHRDDAGVAGATPVADVPVDRTLRVLAQARVVRVAKHVAKEARVLSVRRAEHRAHN